MNSTEPSEQKRSFLLQDFFHCDILVTAGVTHLQEIHLLTMSTLSCVLVSLHGPMCPRHRVWWVIHCEALSTVKQHRGSVGVRRDGDVDDENALVSNAALQRDGGGLHLEAHKSWSVQNPQSEDDPPARLVSDAKHPAHHTRL